MILCISNLFLHKQYLIFRLTIIAFFGYGLGEFPLERSNFINTIRNLTGYLHLVNSTKNNESTKYHYNTALLLYSILISYYRVNGERRRQEGFEWIQESEYTKND